MTTIGQVTATMVALAALSGCSRSADLEGRTAYWRSVLSTAPRYASVGQIRTWGTAHRIDFQGDVQQGLYSFVETLPDSFPCSKQDIEIEVFFNRAGQSDRTAILSKPTCL
jgi:uncharacterized lipoprotein NlpE involved in copper resistance